MTFIASELSCLTICLGSLKDWLFLSFSEETALLLYLDSLFVLVSFWASYASKFLLISPELVTTDLFLDTDRFDLSFAIFANLSGVLVTVNESELC